MISRRWFFALFASLVAALRLPGFASPEYTAFVKPVYWLPSDNPDISIINCAFVTHGEPVVFSWSEDGRLKLNAQVGATNEAYEFDGVTLRRL